MTVESNVVGTSHSSPEHPIDRVDPAQEPHKSASQGKTPEPILCPHCLRTASNGIKCKGICVAESDY